ncbi:MAG TPA: DUF2934 domain-containing protein [Nitrospira sp.]|nr:DUF2934 domain-containing protein [Nitrospira sp.]
MKRTTTLRKFRFVLSGNGREVAAIRSSERVDGSSPDDVHSRIARLTYSFYEQRGGEHGHDVEDWIQAERTVLASQNHVAAKMDESSQR